MNLQQHFERTRVNSKALQPRWFKWTNDFSRVWIVTFRVFTPKTSGMDALMLRISKQPLYLPGNRQCSVATKQFQSTKWIKVMQKIVEIQNKSMRKTAAWRNLTEKQCGFFYFSWFGDFFDLKSFCTSILCFCVVGLVHRFAVYTSSKVEKLKVQSRLLDNQAFQLNSHPEGSCLQVQLTASVCRAGDSSSSESLWSGLCCADTSRERLSSLSLYCLFSFLTSILPSIISHFLSNSTHLPTNIHFHHSRAFNSLYCINTY